MAKKIILTGASGYIGSHLLQIIQENQIPCIAISRSLPNQSIASSTHWFQGDFLDFEIEESLSDYSLIHCAWSKGFDHNSDHHFGSISSHFNFIQGLTSRGLSKIVVLGSMHEYGFSVGEVSETDPLVPTSQYGLAKKALFESLREFCLRNDFDFVWARLFYLKGDDEKNNSVFSKLLKASNSGESEFPLNSGLQKFDFIDCNEASKQILSLAVNDVNSGQYNIGSGESSTLRSALSDFIVQHNLSISLKYGVYPDPPNFPNGIWPDVSKYKLAQQLFRLEIK